MKFEYGDEKGGAECVAFIDGEGDLWIRTEENEGMLNVMFELNGDITPGSVPIEEGMARQGYKKKFYHGDKITITF